jgi:mono/diheme cytochrome c family protein
MTKRRLIVAVIVLLVIAAVLLWLLWPRDREVGEAPAPMRADSADPVERGRALVLLADCKACHTDLGGAEWAGGHSIPTPFGTFFSPNISPDLETGIGGWSADDFWRALHNGRGRGGRPLYPAFPYTNFTKMSRNDSDAMYAYLRTLPPVRQINRPHDLSFPFSQRWLLFAWRALFFRPGVYEANTAHDAEWNRGAYLMQGVAHCSACHEARNALGGIQSRDNPSGGLVLSWYAPSLTSSREAGLQGWKPDQIVRLLKTGQASDQAPARHTAALGPMAEVIYGSLQHVREDELRAMAVYVESLEDSRTLTRGSVTHGVANAASLERGGHIYMDHCAKCHGDNGEGRSPAAPPLAGNRAVVMNTVSDPIHVVLYGGFAPGTEGNPRPFGMPPFYPTLHSDEVADVLSYVRSSWGNNAGAVTVDEVEDQRTGPLW